MSVQDAFDLSGCVAVVTGGNRGLGKAFAIALGEAGTAIAVIARDTARTDAVVKDLTDHGIHARGFRADVARRADVDRVAAEIAGEFGRVHVLVNNADTGMHVPRWRSHGGACIRCSMLRTDPAGGRVDVSDTSTGR